ncbi:hypothetical protein KIN20_036678 [Parelaphostrongylus tenuis]|uniref:FHA domain-containing protein n=1 Tax=Parelaphostrongylus tenuis TaxID=148309 RepID=A0AAD5RCW8_PARTN|nr:hypothetical protein KIN20_036678 [Parelaphostrongylus tenuis]
MPKVFPESTGSLKWSAQNELSFRDSSTYGTVINGKLVKGGCQTLRDGAHIFVGDVELVIAFPRINLTLPHLPLLHRQPLIRAYQ